MAFAGALGRRRTRVAKSPANGLNLAAEADFVFRGSLILGPKSPKAPSVITLGTTASNISFPFYG